MRNKSLFALGFCCYVLGSAVYANGIFTDSVMKPWRPVVGFGGGISSAYNVGRSQTFPIIDPITDSFYIYSTQNRGQSQGLFEAFLGAERPLYSRWQLQAGLAYAQTGSYKARGALTQGADLPSSDQYQYQFKTITRQLLAQAKLMYPYHQRFYPYLLLGLGGAINTSSNFSTTVPPFLTFTREYSKNTSSSFAFRVGAGVDIDVRPHMRLGVAYRFADLGGLSLGAAHIDGIPVGGTLSQSNLYANEVLFQWTYTL